MHAVKLSLKNASVATEADARKAFCFHNSYSGAPNRNESCVCNINI